MKFNNRYFLETVSSQTLCPGTERYNKFHLMMHNFAKAQEIELRQKLDKISRDTRMPQDVERALSLLILEFLGDYPIDNDKATEGSKQ